jgi:phospholipase C
MSVNLEKFDHIIVLMMENRSFDHMLGYLSLPEDLGGKNRSDVDGLTGDESNSLEGVDYPVFHLNFDSQSKNTAEAKELWRNGPDGQPWKPDPGTWTNEKAFLYPDPNADGKWEIIDPCHFCVCVLKQIHTGGKGYVRNFNSVHKEIFPGLVMGYYNHEELPLYDLLAENFLICDRWFSSLPGPTVPNRAYSICGTSNGHTVQPVKRPEFQEDAEPGFRDVLKYHKIPTIFERLNQVGIEWGYYYQDIPFAALWHKHRRRTLSRTAISRSATLKKLLMNYHWLRRKMGIEQGAIAHFDEFKYRLKNAKSSADFPAVTWIDPNFVQAGDVRTANDDHAPSDVLLGQEGVYEVYKAIVESELHDRILFIITYDEHGGFFDHVDPAKYPVKDDFQEMEQIGYGVRVPAIVVSPHVEKGGVSSDVFDHTSILKTILMKYCNLAEGDEEGDWMSKRVFHARSVADLLTDHSDDESIAAQNAELKNRLRELGKRFQDYRRQVEGRQAIELEGADYSVEHNPTHLQQLLESLDKSNQDMR